MKKYLVSSILCIGFGAMTMMQACKKTSETNISSHNANKSHNMGQNCMNCHKKGGEGEGWFYVAGTVYDSTKTRTYSNTTVKLYTGANGTGTLKYTIDGDQLGNFFTTNAIDFGTGLYPAVQGANVIIYMPTATTNGQCNSCHGVTTDKLWTR